MLKYLHMLEKSSTFAADFEDIVSELILLGAIV